MEIKLIISSGENEIDLAILKDKVLSELHKEKSDNSFSVGDVYLGKVRKIIPSLNACFVNVGFERDAFLHYHDLGPQFASMNKYVKRTMSGKQNSSTLGNFRLEPDIDKHGKINERISTNQNILVQVAKEPISNKGPRLTSEITLAGRYIVLVPFSQKISVSARINSREEKSRLKRLVQSITPKNFGVIIRTVAEGKKVADLDTDLRDLVSRWEKIYKNLQNSIPPKRVLGEINRTSAILRDLLNHEFSSIHVDDEPLAEEIKNYLQTIAPDKMKIVKPYVGKRTIFEHFGVHKQIKSAFGKQVNLPSGGYLIIEHTEAMHVIDVNSGNRKVGDQNQEQNAIATNLESAQEIARILKLRDMGGIIVVDFIDMHKRSNQKLLHQALKDYLKDDKAKSNVLPPSRFGLIEITRERVRPETDIETTEQCPTCNGSGKIEASILLTDEIENKLTQITEVHSVKEIAICVHPFVASFLLQKEGLFGKSIKKDWTKKFGKKIEVRAMPAYSLIEYRIFNSEDEELKI